MSRRAQLGSTDSRESFEMDELSDDEDDELYLKHSSNRGSNGDASSVRKPLMRRKRKKNGDAHAASVRAGKPKYRRCCGPLCWIFLGFKTVVGAMIITVILVNYFTHRDFYFWHHWTSSSTSTNYAPCHDLKVIPVWQKEFPKLSQQGNVVTLNVTGDSIPDVVFGFGTGADGYNVPEIVCDIYFQGKTPCMGGIMALNGRDGNVVWTSWTRHEIFTVSCQEDLNGDGVDDCVGGGRAGVLIAVSGKTGDKLWDFDVDHVTHSDLMSMYTPQFIHDLNGDHVSDLLVVHGGDELSDPAQEEHMFGRIMLLSGKTGKVLRWIPTPDRKESYYPPQILTWLDGEQFVIIGTGATVKGGSLFVINLIDLFKGKISQATRIYSDDSKGLMSPAVLVDVTGDGIEDIVFASFNGKVVALNGETFKLLWVCELGEEAESYSSLGVGYFDVDDTPDFLVKYQFGTEGYPTYQYEKVFVVSGLNGTRISPERRNSFGSEAGIITAQAKGRGNDVFLHWSANCLGTTGFKRLNYTFPEYVTLHDRKRADVCQYFFGSHQRAELNAFQRFRTTNESRFNIFNSSYWTAKQTEDTRETAETYLRAHPNLMRDLAEDADYGIFPYLKDDFSDKAAKIKAAMDLVYDDEEEDPDAYVVEGAGDNYLKSRSLLAPSRASSQKRFLNKESIPNMNYNHAAHSIQKSKAEIDEDNFEQPYKRKRKRKKRQAEEAKE